MKRLAFGFAVVSVCLTGYIQAQDTAYAVPVTEWGQPDLQGVWNFATNIPLERPAAFADKAVLTNDEIAALAAQTEFGLQALNDAGANGYNTFWLEMGSGLDNRTSLMVYPEDGRLPPAHEDVSTINGGLADDVDGTRPVRFIVGGIGKDGPEDRGLSERCLMGFNAGPPFTPNLYNNNIQIFQNKDTAVIMTEMVHTARIVPLDGRDHIDDELRLWSGDSRGYWDGETLVVETRNFNNLTKSFGAFGDSSNKLLIERFTRTGPFTMEYEFTVDDPSTFTDRFTAMITMSKVNGLIYEYACHEGNYAMQNLLRAARMEEQGLAGSDQ
ncbi:MAG: hypothetical protein KJN90_10170 [Gammaproteobacteria bacterium]|nr:hypothetical protein [Gammaproteobacteria bacterium]